MNEIEENWPFPYPPRQNQTKAFEWISANKDARNLILECPVGSGKSNIGITYSLYKSQSLPMRGSYILTPQKILQKQYEDSFQDIAQIHLASLYGRANYKCAPKNANCEIGSMFKPACDFCPYKDARFRAIKSQNTVLNYKLALTAFAYTNMFDRRALLIMDECHTLEDHLIDFDAVHITQRRCDKYDLPFELYKAIPPAVSWLVEVYLPKLDEVFQKLDMECSYIKEKPGDEITSKEAQKIKECEALGEHFDAAKELSLQQLDYIEREYVLTHEETLFSFKRLYGRYTFNRILVPQADQMLYMSSTVLNKDGYCKDLGIKPEETAFISLPSEFAPENRPVYSMPRMKMNYKWKDDDNKKGREEMITTIKTLLELHKDESGIIHTGNFAISKWIVKELYKDAKHTIYHHNPDGKDNRGDVITGFLNDKHPSVLISPSITEGLDLKDDLGRFAIIVKVPYGALGDNWIKKRMELSTEWYQRKALIDIIQGGGRIVRGPEDKGTVYILDGSWAYLKKQTDYMIPKWWKEAYKVVR